MKRNQETINHKKSFLIIIFIFISIFILQNNVYGLILGPYKNENYIDVNKKDYGWMKETNKSKLSIDISETTSKFITEDEIRRYIKLKIRNFIKDYRFIDNKPKDNNFTFSECSIQIYKYNDKMEIYWGIFHFGMLSSIKYYKECWKRYFYVNPISGSDNQIRNRIKKEIDNFIEYFSEDYYYMKDLK